MKRLPMNEALHGSVSFFYAFYNLLNTICVCQTRWWKPRHYPIKCV